MAGNTLNSLVLDSDGDPQTRCDFLRQLGMAEPEKGLANFQSLANSGLTHDLFGEFCLQIERHLPDVSDADMAINNLERFVSVSRSPLALGTLLQRDPTALPILLRIFSSSQYFSDLLVRDSESYDYLRLTEGQSYSRSVLVDDLAVEVSNATEAEQMMQILRRFKQREMLRIAFGDLIVEHQIETVTRQISYVAEAVCEGALGFVFNQLIEKWGQPKLPAGQPCRFCALAMGKLGGNELNYSSDIDLVFVYEADGATDQGRTNQQFFERLCRDTVKLLTEPTPVGVAYRVDLRLRPEGSRGRICTTLKAMLQYYDLQGRTWERQALIKARPIAGDLELGEQLIGKLQPWIFQRNLGIANINGIKALKRKIERQALEAGEEFTNVKTGHGGIRDIEFSIQFLQLLNGRLSSQIQSTNTLEAIRQLSLADCLNRNEADLLIQNYAWLRKLEHRLQIMFDIQTHTLPTEPVELEKVARRMGYSDEGPETALQQFQTDFQGVTQSNRRILDHLLASGFEADSAEDEVPLAVDLILDPTPTEKMKSRVLNEAGFRDLDSAFQNLIGLSSESTVFLSSKRCRHFLASILPNLLEEISQTPDPDATLRSLSSVADSIGAKGVLWELFQFHPPSLNLFVRLCASSDYLTRILRSNPGMVDELVDSLMMEQLPSIEWLRDNLDDLTRNSPDADPIIHSFKNAQHLRVGVRDILGRDSIRETHRSLSDIAQVCLENITNQEYQRLSEKYFNEDAANEFKLPRNNLVVLGLGKLGGQEPNYHSDLDVIFLYQPDPQIESQRTTTDQHFFSELAAKITKRVSQVGPFGKLYEIDSRLRPTGRSGTLTVSFPEFEKYFRSGQGQIWERQALCKTRPIYGRTELIQLALQRVSQILTEVPWQAEFAEQIRDMRLRWQQGASPQNLKRGVGGTVDVEFLVQMLQLRNLEKFPGLRVPGTINAIGKLEELKLLPTNLASAIKHNYQVLRSVEARLRLMDTSARHDMPESHEDLTKLAFLLQSPSVEQLIESVAQARKSNREIFDEMFDRAALGSEAHE